MKGLFRKIATKVAQVTGEATTFLIALTVIICWAALGPLFNFSNTWQLVINTTTTIVTFLMVFLIQNTQNRDGRAVQLKLDELILTSREASDAFVDLEELTDEEIERLETEFRTLRDRYSDRQLPTVHNFHKKIKAVREKRLSH